MKANKLETVEAPRALTVLFDFDSMLYKASYKVATIQDIRKWFKMGKSKDWMRQEIVELSVNRLSNMSDAIFETIEDTGITIGNTVYYMTDCRQSFRKEVSEIYKIHRPQNKWVRLVRRRLLDMSFAVVSDVYEADDLIARDHAILGEDKCLILSMDKDLKQLPGIHFDYYRKPTRKLADGTYPLGADGFKLVHPYRGLSFVSQQQANKLFWTQMLQGDTSDNITGVKGIGKVKANKIIEAADPSQYEEKVKEQFIRAYGKEEGVKAFDLTYQLIKLGIRDEYEDDAQPIEDFTY
jgi:5'-3' exonuclease